MNIDSDFCFGHPSKNKTEKKISDWVLAGLFLATYPDILRKKLLSANIYLLHVFSIK